MTALQAIRANCLSCCDGSAYVADHCNLTTCDLWPFRLGRSPRTSREPKPAALDPYGFEEGGERETVLRY